MKEKIFPQLLADFLYAVLAGLAISLGGAVFLAIDNKIIGALFFTVGLFTVCVNGFNLFTGKVGYAWRQPPSYLLFLLVVWLGNLAGTCGLCRKSRRYIRRQTGRRSLKHLCAGRFL